MPSFHRIKLKKFDLLKQPPHDFINKMNYLNVKFKELNSKIKQTDFQNLDQFLSRITEPLIELYVSVFVVNNMNSN